MTKDNQNELYVYLQHIGTQAVKRFADDNGIDLDIEMYVKDKSKIKWKSKSHFIKLYKQELQRLMTKKVIDIEMLGFLTLLSLYLDYEDNSLIKDDRYLNQKDILELTGWSKNKVSKFIKAAIDNKFIYEEKQENDKRKSMYYLNPNLFFRGQKIDKETKQYYDNIN
jgi:DNA-binding MarR family transcriptional regulator